MISAVYAGILALLLVWLSLQVIRLRRSNHIPLGDGGVPALQNAIRAQGNATEYVPISLILLILLEWNGVHPALIHVAGIALLIGRFLHARGLLTENLRYRVLGMQFTLFSIIGLALTNIGYSVIKQF